MSLSALLHTINYNTFSARKTKPTTRLRAELLSNKDKSSPILSNRGANSLAEQHYIVDYLLRDSIERHDPYDILDTALADTIERFPLNIELFKGMIQGIRMDTRGARYENFEELELYCYCVAGTIGLMTIPVMGNSPKPFTNAGSIYKATICLGIGNQLTNILRDVVEDALRGRIYLPQDELREFGLTEEDILSRKVTEEWRELMKKQIARARWYFDQAEHGISQLDYASRWPVWVSLILYRKILDKIEENNYDNLTTRVRVQMAEKLITLPLAYAKAKGWRQ